MPDSLDGELLRGCTDLEVAARTVPADLSTDAGVDKVLTALSGLRVDGLINNAAIGGFAYFAVGRPLEQGLAMIRLNVAALTRQDRPPLF